MLEYDKNAIVQNANTAKANIHLLFSEYTAIIFLFF